MTDDHAGEDPCNCHDLERQVEATMARWFWRAAAAMVTVIVTVVIWAVRLEGKAEYNDRRIEEIRTEGSLPLNDLESKIEVLIFQMDGLTKDLKDTRAIITGSTR